LRVVSAGMPSSVGDPQVLGARVEAAGLRVERLV
jgi:hypothetical protein